MKRLGAYIGRCDAALRHDECRCDGKTCDQGLNAVTDLDASDKGAFLGIILKRKQRTLGETYGSLAGLDDPLLFLYAAVDLGIERLVAFQDLVGVKLDCFHAFQRQKLLKLCRSLLGMASYDDHAAVSCVGLDHIRALKQWLIGYAAHSLDKACCGTELKYLSLLVCQIEGNREYLQVNIVDRVDADLIESLYFDDLGNDLVQCRGYGITFTGCGKFLSRLAKIIQGDTDNVSCFVLAAGLFFYILRNGGMRITEGLVLCKLGIRCGYQFIALLDVMDVADRKASALLEEGAHDLAVDHIAVCFHAFFQKPGLQREMSAHGRVAAA